MVGEGTSGAAKEHALQRSHRAPAKHARSRAAPQKERSPRVRAAPAGKRARRRRPQRSRASRSRTARSAAPARDRTRQPARKSATHSTHVFRGNPAGAGEASEQASAGGRISARGQRSIGRSETTRNNVTRAAGAHRKGGVGRKGRPGWETERGRESHRGVPDEVADALLRDEREPRVVHLICVYTTQRISNKHGQDAAKVTPTTQGPDIQSAEPARTHVHEHATSEASRTAQESARSEPGVQARTHGRQQVAEFEPGLARSLRCRACSRGEPAIKEAGYGSNTRPGIAKQAEEAKANQAGVWAKLSERTGVCVDTTSTDCPSATTLVVLQTGHARSARFRVQRNTVEGKAVTSGKEVARRGAPGEDAADCTDTVGAGEHPHLCAARGTARTTHSTCMRKALGQAASSQYLPQEAMEGTETRHSTIPLPPGKQQPR